MGSSGRPVSVCNPGYCPVPVERPDLRIFPSQGKSRSRTPSVHNTNLGEFVDMVTHYNLF